MSWRTASPTSGFGVTVDFTADRPKTPVTLALARTLIEKGREEQKGWGGHALAIAFHDAALSVLSALEATMPNALVEIVTSGHVDDVNGGYGSIALNIHRPK